MFEIIKNYIKKLAKNSQKFLFVIYEEFLRCIFLEIHQLKLLTKID